MEYYPATDFSLEDTGFELSDGDKKFYIFGRKQACGHPSVSEASERFNEILVWAKHFVGFDKFDVPEVADWVRENQFVAGPLFILDFGLKLMKI